MLQHPDSHVIARLTIHGDLLSDWKRSEAVSPLRLRNILLNDHVA